MTSTDHDIMQQARGKRSAYRLAGLLLVGGVGCTAVAALGIGQSWTQHMGLNEHHYNLFLGIGAGMLSALAVGAFWKARFHSGPGADRIDAAQARQRQVLMAITVMVVAFGGIAILHAFHNQGPLEMDLSIEFALLAVAAAAATTFGVGFAQRKYRAAANDELVRLLRGRAAQLGYMLAVAGVGLGYLASLLRPELTGIVLPVFLLAAVAGPAVYFLVAEWRASSDG
jgi:hypothetical protein